MTTTEKLKSVLNNEYESEDGDCYKVELMRGMTDSEIDTFKKTLPSQHIPEEIEELLIFSKGFEFYGLDEVRFDAYAQFGFEEMFPYSIQLAEDGFGNFWILDIDSKGNWGAVYYMCHDPAVIVKHSENLKDFIGHVDEHGKKGSESNLDFIQEQVVSDIWKEKVGIMERNEKDYHFESGKTQLPQRYLVADLANEPIQAGFAWGKSGPDTSIIRPGDEAIWIIEKKVRQGFLSRLFNRN